MVTAAPIKRHNHIFEIKGETGFCPCGEVRKYRETANLRDSTFEVLKVGDPNYKDSPTITTISNPAVKEIPAPVKPLAKREVASYYERSKNFILEDCKTLNSTAVCKKWGMSSSTLWKLQKRWQVRPMIAAETKKAEKPITERPKAESADFAGDALDILILHWRDQLNSNPSESRSVKTLWKMTIKALERLQSQSVSLE